MFSSWLQYIRQQPKPVRERYALGLSVVVMVVIVGGWGWSLPDRFANLPGNESGQVANRPFAGLWGNLKDQLAGVAASGVLPPATTTPNNLETVFRGVESGDIIPPASTPPTPARPTIMIATTSSATTSPEAE